MFNRGNRTDRTAALRLDFKVTALPQIMHVMHIAKNWNNLDVRMGFQNVLWHFAIDIPDGGNYMDSLAGRQEAIRNMLTTLKIGFKHSFMFQDAVTFPITHTEFRNDIADDAFEKWFEGLGARFKE